MHKLLSVSLVVIAIGAGCGADSNRHKNIDIDNDTEKYITHIIDSQKDAANSGHLGNIINNVSADFLGTPYKANMLIGSSTQSEKLVINLNGLDCFTYLDYVNALSKSTETNNFVKQLINTRYINSDISYKNRKHFFTDWSQRYPLNARDVTAEISPHSVVVTKHLNQRENGSEFIPTLGVTTRDVVYIPAAFVDRQVVHNLKTGDYIGIYTHIKGLDVTHAGIFIMTPNGAIFRHASSLKNNSGVVDLPFIDYVKNTPGIIVLRAL
ncbi:putative lipoprotein [Yersinia rohdei]|uniref:Putative lipoprotein n=1 Tax=Yersinia rohdei TaxID=29485 RepID=A0A0U1HPP2_YERRO|nr:DUF1460 domain-containing protein [Yersinia rohdei]CQI88482.1 putative lipoprotein [Yersinia rohdei]